MQYSIYKDTDVNSTVDRIKSILDDVGIEIEEDITEFPIQDKYRPHSMRITMFGQEKIGTNGKGTSLGNCKASAYAEFIERLQNLLLSNEGLRADNFIYSPDEKYELKNEQEIIEKYYDKEFLDNINKISKLRNPWKKQVYIPVYSLKNNKVEYFSIYSLLSIQGSVGMVAGNTPEEAIVQGLSEICERYATKLAVMDNIVMPDVPKEIYEQYENIKGMVKYIEKYGYSVTIKDASLGKKLPVICAVFEDKKNGLFSFKFGSHPSFPIAIERTLTEIAQGGISYEQIQSSIKDANLSRQDLFEYSSLSKLFLKTDENTVIYNQFIKKEYDYQFSKEAWVDEKKRYTNQNLLEFLINNISDITHNDIYIRDNSFLGFPSFYIFIPGVSEIDACAEKINEAEYNLVYWLDYTEDKYKEHKDIKTLISALKYKATVQPAKYKKNLICLLDNLYLLFLCYIVEKDRENILKYCDIFLKTDNFPKKNIIMILKEYYTLNENIKDDDEIEKILCSKYSKENIENFKKFIYYLNFEQIKKLIRSSNLKRLEENKIPCETEEKIEAVRQNLIKKYKANIPNQSKLAEHFKFLH